MGEFRASGKPVNWIAADMVRIYHDVLVEQWDVIQDEATREQSKVGNQCSATFSRPNLEREDYGNRSESKPA
jgi:hypothetical protein